MERKRWNKKRKENKLGFLVAKDLFDGKENERREE
jgi:hypothetical protein